MATVTAELLKQGILGLFLFVFMGVIIALWKYLVSEREAYARRTKELSESHLAITKEVQDKFDNRLSVLSEASQKSNADTLSQILVLAKDVTKTTENVSCVIQQNTHVIEGFATKVDSIGEKVLVLSERVEKLEGGK